MTETLAHGYSFESTLRELSNEYQQDRVYMIFKNLCFIVVWMKVALALEGLTLLMLTATKSSLAILMKSSRQRHSKKTFDGEMLIRTLTTTLLQISCKNFLNSKVIVKNIIDPDNHFLGNSKALMGY